MHDEGRDSAISGSTCVICFDKPSDILLSCGHYKTCWSCFNRSKQMHEKMIDELQLAFIHEVPKFRCPHCNSHVTGHVHVKRIFLWKFTESKFMLFDVHAILKVLSADCNLLYNDLFNRKVHIFWCRVDWFEQTRSASRKFKNFNKFGKKIYFSNSLRSRIKGWQALSREPK